jgi:long-chain acyl-CoA synthetase
MTQDPWLKSYPAGVRWDAPLEGSAATRLLDTAAARWPQQPALEFMGRRIGFAELKQLAERAALGLQQLGVGPGVHVGLFLPNTPHYVIAFFGILKAGGVVVNYSPLDAEKTLEHKIGDSESDIIVTLDLASLAPMMERFLGGRTRLKKLVIGDLAEFSGAPAAVRASMKQGGQLADVAYDAQRLPFARLLDNDGACREHPVGDPATALAMLQYTGGTTGTPKGAMLTHTNLTVACEQMALPNVGDPPLMLDGVERFLGVLPLFHIYALVVNMLFSLRIGAELILHVKFDATAAARDIAQKKVTLLPGVPTMYSALLNLPEIRNYDLSSLKVCGSGGAPLPVQLNADFQKLSGRELGEGWGMTETTAMGTFSPLGGERHFGSCGIPRPGIRLKFVDVTDPAREVPLGEKGELCIRGPNVMAGYWKNPKATAESMTADGYFRTGDVGYMDDQGYVYLIDRTKDMILCGGFNVYPRLIEEAVIQHPAVAEVCVIGVPDEYRGQSPKAFVTLKPGATPPTLDSLKQFLGDKLGKHEMVQHLDIRDELPKTPVGKLSKKALYDEEERRRAAGGAG